MPVPDTAAKVFEDRFIDRIHLQIVPSKGGPDSLGVLLQRMSQLCVADLVHQFFRHLLFRSRKPYSLGRRVPDLSGSQGKGVGKSLDPLFCDPGLCRKDLLPEADPVRAPQFLHRKEKAFRQIVRRFLRLCEQIDAAGLRQKICTQKALKLCPGILLKELQPRDHRYIV